MWVYGALALGLFLVGCEQAEPVTVIADPALQVPLEQLAPEFRQVYGGGWRIEYRESAALQQLTADSQPDVLLTVEPTAQSLLKNGLLDESSMRTFAGDRLVVVSARDKPRALGSVGDLVMTMFSSIAVGRPDTSAGLYGEQALIADGAHGKIQDKIKLYGSLAEICSVVASSESSYGIVFASTAAQNPKLAVSTTVPEDLHQDIKYTAVAAKGAAEKPGVVALLKLLAEEPETQQLLGSYGYLDRMAALQEAK
jgi:molybdate transport system substrate-binding protein